MSAFRAIGKTIGKGLGFGARTGAKALFSRAGGRAAMTAAKWYGYRGAADFIDRYAEGNFDSSGARMVAGAASGMLRLKSYHSLARGAMNTAGAAAKRWHTVDAFGYKMSIPMVRNFGMAGARGGVLDAMVSNRNIARLALKGAGYAGKGAANVVASPINALHGAGGYAASFGKGAVAAARAPTFSAGFRAGWGTLGTNLARIQHPFAPFVYGGLAYGGLSAAAGRLDLTNGNIASRTDVPQLPGLFESGARGPVNEGNFGQGVSFGRRSSINSGYVRQGQQAVTMKMVGARRV